MNLNVNRTCSSRHCSYTAGPEDHSQVQAFTAQRQGTGLGKGWGMMEGGRDGGDERVNPTVKSATGEGGICVEFL